MTKVTPVIRVLVVDDHKLFRQGLFALLMSAKDIQIIGEARDGQEGIELARRLRPDVILMDLEMPRVNGLEATRMLRQDLASTKILVLSMRTSEKDIREAARSGAQGYLIKNCGRDELVGSIREVQAGRVACSPDAAAYFLAERAPK